MRLLLRTSTSAASLLLRKIPFVEGDMVDMVVRWKTATRKEAQRSKVHNQGDSVDSVSRAY